MFPNVLSSQSLHYYNKYITEYRHQYEEILKHYSSSKAKRIAYQSQDILSTPPYFVENLLNGKTEKDESSVGSPPSSEYNDDTLQKSPSANSHLMDVRSGESPPMSPASQDSHLHENAPRQRSGKSCPVDVPKDYSTYGSQPYRHVSSYAVDRICGSPKTASSSNGTTSPVDSDNLVHRDSTPPAGEFNSYTEDGFTNTCSEKYGKYILLC